MAGVIKTGRIVGKSVGATTSVFKFNDVAQQANAYVGDAKQEAARIIEAANLEAEQIRQRAAEQGRQDALDQAREQVITELDQNLQTLLPALEQAILSVEQARNECLRQWELEFIGLSTRIAERMIGRELTHDPSISLDWIQQALGLAAGNTQIILKLNPEDYKTIHDGKDALVNSLSNVMPTAIVEDESISRGGCKVTTEFGEIEQTLEAQLQRLRDELSGQ